MGCTVGESEQWDCEKFWRIMYLSFSTSMSDDIISGLYLLVWWSLDLCSALLWSWNLNMMIYTLNLLGKIMQVYKNVVLQNEYQSSRLCEALYTRCEDKMDQLQVLKLPSLAKFNAGFLQCNRSFEHECVGPSKTNYELRMMKVWYN